MFDDKIKTGVIDLGISAAAYFDISDEAGKDFKFDPRFRQLCKNNTCGSYGRNYMCPPSIGSLEDCMSDILRFKHALIIETIHVLEDPFDYEGMMDGGKAHKDNVDRVLEYIKNNIDYSEIKILSAGGCKVCEKCGILDNVPCRFPELAIASLEGYAVDVAHLTTTHGLNYINGENTVTYVAVYLVK